MAISVLIVQYLGSNFNGFQRQKEFPTVQGSLERVLKIILREAITVVPAGRTDTGVHAKGMPVSFSTTKPIENYHRLLIALNSLLDKGVTVLAAAAMPDRFHARFSCTEREYEYWILHSRQPSALMEGRALRIHKDLDWESLKKEIPVFLGKHKFSSFAKVSSIEGKSTERVIHKIEITSSNDWKGLYKISIKGTGFLHNMVRIIVGTLLDKTTGKIEMNLEEILQSENRTLAGRTLPPYGLYFKKASYRDYPEIEALYDSEVC